MMDDKAAVELLLKIQVPHMGIQKTMRANTGHKVASLTDQIVEKLETADKQDFSRFGLYWYSETGPLWLAENSYIRSYGLKSGDVLQYKVKPTIVAGPANAPVHAPIVSRKNSSPFLSAARSRTVSNPQIALPALPSSPSFSAKSPREGHKSAAKEALLKAFQFGDKKESQVPPPPSHPHHQRPISVSTPIPPTKSFPAPPPPVIIPNEDFLMQKSQSTPSPTITGHRMHSATAPPKPISPLSLSSPSTLDDPNNISPRQHSPLQPHTPSHRAPPSPLQPPPPLSTPSFSSSFYNSTSPTNFANSTDSINSTSSTTSTDSKPPPLPRMPSQLPPLYRAPSSDTCGVESQVTHACACEHNKTQTCAHRDELDRVSEKARKLTQRVELAECILTDTLQAIEEGEADLQAIKMYLTTALASLRRQDAAQISFGK